MGGFAAAPTVPVSLQCRQELAAVAGHSRARSCEARFRQNGHTREQPCREQPPADPQARTPDVQLSRCASHAGVAQTSNERGMSSCCTQRTLRHMAWLDYHWRSRENYLIRTTTLELHR